MKILDRYVFSSFVKISLGTIALTTSMMVVVELFINFQTFMSLKMYQTAHLLLLHIPNSINLVLGPSLLFATTYFISTLYSNNEFISLLSAGISYRRIILPIVVLAFVYTALLAVFNEKIKIPYDIKYDAKKMEYLNKDTTIMYDNRNVSITDKDNRLTIRASKYNDLQKKLDNITMATFGEDGALTEKIVAPSATFDDKTGEWMLKTPTIYEFDRETFGIKPRHMEDMPYPRLKIEPRFFRAQGDDIRTMKLTEAHEYLRLIKFISREIYAEKYTEYCRRISSSVIALVMVFVSLSINLKNRKNVLMASMITALALGVVYYACDMGFSLLAKQGVVNPLAATIIPIGFIISVAVFGATRVAT